MKLPEELGIYEITHWENVEIVECPLFKEGEAHCFHKNRIYCKGFEVQGKMIHDICLIDCEQSKFRKIE
jgi:hypothetical protein